LSWTVKDWIDFFDNVTLVMVSLLFARFWPRPFNRVMKRAEGFLARLGCRPVASLMAVFLFGVLFRVSLLPVLPVPAPQAHDEFSYLLAADTFAHGRLTNPTPAMWKHIETFHMIFTPTYQSQYPPAQGLLLAFGQVLGSPFIGVVLGTAFMCAVLVWSLRGWMSPKWALLAGFLMVLRYCGSHYWTNSYWGGAIPALGGALVFGAAARIVNRRRTRDAVLFALGTMTLANSRPYEGLVLVVVVGGWVLFRVLKDRWSLSQFTRQLAAPACAVFLLIGSWMAFYNWRVTGNAETMPYEVNIKQYKYARPFLWEHPVTPPHYRFDVMRRYFAWELYGWNATRTVSGTVGLVAMRTKAYYDRYVYPMLVPFLIACLWFWRGRKYRIVLLVVAAMWLAVMVESWGPNEHYFAPALTPVLVMMIYGLREMRLWKMNTRLGLHWSRILILFFVFQMIGENVEGVIDHYDSAPKWPAQRAEMIKQLQRSGGQHLILVEYAPDHIFHNEWVFNGSDPDHAPVVWAREMSPAEDRELFEYYPNRKVWLFRPDDPSPQLIAYDWRSQQPKITAPGQ
jgi:hypothetical protein